jgi:hypothetical protein
MLERKSTCCLSSVRVVGRKNTNYWVCVGCGKACDAVLPERVALPAKRFDALADRLQQPAQPSAAVARVLITPLQIEEEADELVA